MQQIRKVFDGTITPDVAAPVRKAGAVTMASLLRWQGDSVQQAGRWVPLPPTQDVATWDATSRVYAHWADKAYGRYFLFVYDGALGRHLIYCYDGSALRVVLDEADMDEPLLWDEEHPPQVTMIGRHLIWTDGQSDPMMIDVESAMQTYDATYVPVDGLSVHLYDLPFEAVNDLYVLRRPPRYAPQPIKTTSANAPDGPYEANVIELAHLQFATRYLYFDGSVSAIGPYSEVLPPNMDGDTEDAVQVSLPVDERIPRRVKRVIWMVREGIDGPWFEFAESEGQALADHNDGTAQLTAWYGKRRLGTAVGESDSARLWDSVPIRALATAAAGGRLLFGGTEEDRWHDGTPTLTVTPSTSSFGATGVPGTYLLVTAVCDIDYDQVVFVQVTGQGSIDGYYWTDLPPGAFSSGTLPDVITLSSSDKVSATTEQELIEMVSPCGGSYDAAQSNVDSTYGGTQPTIYGLSGTVPAGTRVFKGGGTYTVGVAFYDKAGRTDGVHALTDVSVPVAPFDMNTVFDSLGWQLPSSAATSEIPAWADTYALCITRNDAMAHFVECFTDTIRYAVMADDGTYNTSGTTYATTYDGLAIDISRLLAAGMGYVHADGDYAVLALADGTTHTLAVRAVWGNYVITELKDIGDTITLSARVELVTPTPSTDTFYEATPRYRVNKLGGARYYSVTSGPIAGDVFLLDRGDPVPVEAMSPNDTVWHQWHPSLGKPTVKAAREPAPFFATRVRWGDTWHTDGPVVFPTFYPLNYVDGDPAAGPIRAMRTLDRSTTGGTVLVCIGEERVLTGYVRVTELVDQRGESTLVRTDTYLAKLDMLAAEAGTTHPESVVQIDNYILFVDSRRGEVMRYSIGGVTPVSKLSGWSTITNAWAARLRGYQDAFGQSVWVPAGMDRGTNEYVVSMREYGLRRRSSKYGYDPKLWDYLAGAVIDTGLLVPQGTTSITLTGTTVGEWHEVDVVANGLATVSVRVDGVEVFYGSGLTAYKAYFFSTAPTHVIEVDLVENVMASYTVRQVEVDRHEADPVLDRSLVWSNAYERLTTSWPLAWDYWAGGLPWSLACYRGRLVRIEEGVAATNPQLFGYAVDGFVSFLLQYSPVPYKLYGMTIDGGGVDYMHIKSGDHYEQATDADAGNMRMYAGRIRVPIYKDMLTDTADVYASRYNGETLFGRAPSVVIVCNDSRTSNYIDMVTVNVTADKGHVETI